MKEKTDGKTCVHVVQRRSGRNRRAKFKLYSHQQNETLLEYRVPNFAKLNMEKEIEKSNNQDRI